MEAALAAAAAGGPEQTPHSPQPQQQNAAAEVMMQNPTQFKRNVYSSMRGGYVDGVRFG